MFDLVYAATAWHWLDPALRYHKAHHLLRPQQIQVRRYAADEYIALLDTFSGHITMDTAKREHLYREIRQRIDGAPIHGCGATGTRFCASRGASTSGGSPGTLARRLA